MKIYKALTFTVLLLAIPVLLIACNSNSKLPSAGTEAPSGITAASPQLTAVLTGIDETGSTVSLMDIGYNRLISLDIGGATAVYNTDKSLTTINSYDIGMILTVEYDESSMKAVSMVPCEDSWCYEDIVNWSLDSDKHIFKIADTKYQYDDNLYVSEGDKTQDIMCLNTVDKLKAYGIGKKIYSINVIEGHGYIRPVTYDDFVGGTMYVGYTTNQPVTADMLVVVREGTYEVTMRNGDLVGSREVEVRPNEETVLDMSEFRQKPDNKGQVEFKVTPVGADLYVNGRLTDYSEPVELNYGKHNIEVELTGYETYIGILDVKSPNPTVAVNLSEEAADIVEDSSSDNNNQTEEVPGPTAASSVNESSSSEVAKENIQYDKSHTITVSTPVGAEVYINGEYKGIAPCSFPKQIGTATLTLSSSGYTTKSYTVVIPDDSKDITWSFPSLVAGS